MTWLLCGAIAVGAFSLGYAAACLLIGGKDSDLESANNYLLEEVTRWKKECADLRKRLKHGR